MYRSEDFKKCLFNPCVIDIFDAYEQLGKIKAISDKIDDKLMKYIVCVYDYRSPIVINNRELKIRKQLGAEMAGYNMQSNELTALFNIEYDYVLAAIDTFLKSFIHSRTWYMICSNESAFWEYGQRMLSPVGTISEDGGKKMSEKDIMAAMALKTKLSEDMLAIDERLDASYKKLYGDDVNRMVNRGTTPETIAKERKYA